MGHEQRPQLRRRRRPRDHPADRQGRRPAPRRLAHARARRGRHGGTPSGDGRRRTDDRAVRRHRRRDRRRARAHARATAASTHSSRSCRRRASASSSTSTRSVTGGGFVDHDPETRPLHGRARARRSRPSGLGAIVVVDTQLPGDPDGWALFASIFATFPSLPLGFGFFLSGVGGLVCLNRTMDAEAIADGLKSGAVDAILFPDDPLDDAELIISQLDAWFPLAEGSAVFGVAATITWGTPKAIVTGQLGVMVSFPDLDIAVLGSVLMALPDRGGGAARAAHGHDRRDRHLRADACSSRRASTTRRCSRRSTSRATWRCTPASATTRTSCSRSAATTRTSSRPAGLPASVTNLRPDARRGRAQRGRLVRARGLRRGHLEHAPVRRAGEPRGEREVPRRRPTPRAARSASTSCSSSRRSRSSPTSTPASRSRPATATRSCSRSTSTRTSRARSRGTRPAPRAFDFFGIDVTFEIEVGGSAGAEAPPRENVLELVVDGAAGRRRRGGARSPAGADTTVVVARGRRRRSTDEVWVAPRRRARGRADGRAARRVRSTATAIYEIDGPTTLDVTARRASTATRPRPPGSRCSTGSRPRSTTT